MTPCPECETDLDLDEDELEEGEIVSCPECGTDFEVVTTVALVLATAVGNLIPTGAGFNANPATLDAAAVTTYALRDGSPTPTIGWANYLREEVRNALAHVRRTGRREVNPDHPEERKRLGITDGFLRMSVGIEDETDILADIDRALDRV